MLLLVKVDIFVSFLTLFSAIENFYNAVEEFSFENVVRPEELRIGDRLITKISLDVTHKEALQACRAMFKELYFPDRNEDVVQIFNKFSVTEVHLPFEKSSITGELYDRRGFGLVLTMKDTVATSNIDLAGFTKNHFATLKRNAERFTYEMVSHDTVKNALCSDNLSYPHREIDELTLKKVKDELKSRIQLEKKYLEDFERNTQNLVQQLPKGPKNSSKIQFDANINYQEKIDEKIQEWEREVNSFTTQFTNQKTELDMFSNLIKFENLATTLETIANLITDPVHHPENFIPENLKTSLKPPLFSSIAHDTGIVHTKWFDEKSIMIKFHEKTKTEQIVEQVVPINDDFFTVTFYDLVLTTIVSFVAFIASLTKCVRFLAGRRKRRGQQATEPQVLQMKIEQPPPSRNYRYSPVACQDPITVQNFYYTERAMRSRGLPTNAHTFIETVREVPPRKRYEAPIWRCPSSFSLN